MLCGGMLSVCYYHDFLKRLFKQKNVTIDKNLATGALYLFLNQTDFNEHTYHTHTKAGMQFSIQSRKQTVHLK